MPPKSAPDHPGHFAVCDDIEIIYKQHHHKDKNVVLLALQAIRLQQ